MIFLNSNMGTQIFEEIEGDIIFENAPIVESLACNPSAWKSPTLKKEHFIFFDNYKKMKIKDLVEIIEEERIPCDFVEFD
ncbi:hypothetical protein ELI_3845 [Eubacterium callanderi]|uniref:Uncharacterized protein n=1 Tax=Eubacterium callanderi TaxID=53442 RepID=E3GGI7_9FIRM|nr:hypothetical protein ELI_3845 [Eubacterium callanderi]